MNQANLPNLPPDLQARLDAAGVRDAASLQQALDGDPALRDDYVAFIEAHPHTSTPAAAATHATDSGAQSFTNENVTVQRDLNQAGRDLTIYNTSNIHQAPLERRWERPESLDLGKYGPAARQSEQVCRIVACSGWRGDHWWRAGSAGYGRHWQDSVGKPVRAAV